MLKIKISLFILLFTFLSIFSQQESINNYKYIIVPERFDFQKNDDSFQINSLTKFLFEKYGFTALKNSEIFPEDLSRNRCLALTTRMNNSSGMFGKKKLILTWLTAVTLLFIRQKTLLQRRKIIKKHINK